MDDFYAARSGTIPPLPWPNFAPPLIDAPFLHGKAGVIRRADGSATSFMGSLNETREGWSGNYEIVWEDSSSDGVGWVEEEFEHLWRKGKPLPDAIIEEIGRCARRVEVQLDELKPQEVAPAALVESNLYRGGDQLMPWQRAFVGLFLRHREMYGKARLLLADEVGVGKTLSLAGSALVAALLEDEPILILCPSTLTTQWQMELKDKLNVPSAVWLSQKKAWQIDPDELPLPSVGAGGIARCPRRIAIVSTGLIFKMSQEREILKATKFGMVILDEAHRARGSRELGDEERNPNNLLDFMLAIARKSRHILLATATPIQTDIADLWELMNVISQDADFVMGDAWSRWRDTDRAVPLLTGTEYPTTSSEAWEWFRNPLPPSAERPIFGTIRQAIDMPDDKFVTTKLFSAVPDDGFTREQFDDEISIPSNGLRFFQTNNPVVRHVVIRRRSTLEAAGLLDRIAVDIHPLAGSAPAALFDGMGVSTSAAFDAAYEAANKFTEAFGKRKKSAGLLKGLILQRICSSFAAGIATARKLLEGRKIEDEDQSELDFDVGDVIEEERRYLKTIIDCLDTGESDPKLKAVLFYLIERRWLDHGCIVFSQYYDTSHWIGKELSHQLPEETVAVYAGAGKSGLFLNGAWNSVERDHIKKAVKDKLIRLVVATDAACEGLNLQTLGTLIDVDLPWNPSRLEQRIGRIKRFGQRRDRVDMLNLVYHGTVDEKVYEVLSDRMKDRFDIFGTLPDVIKDEWIEDITKLRDELENYTQKRRQANAFDIRYADTAISDDQAWELCERVLARADVTKRLSEGWARAGSAINAQSETG